MPGPEPEQNRKDTGKWSLDAFVIISLWLKSPKDLTIMNAPCSFHFFSFQQNINKLVSLEELRLDYNRIAVIENLEQCTKLQELSLCYNQLSSTGLSGLARATQLQVSE
jgi:Leucine-rich repeat (LRR) protein